MKRICWSVTLFAILAPAAYADTPEFDRPGISFSTTTLPPGSFDWEQGLPDFEHDSEQGTKSTLYSADTTLRIGVAEHVEVQIGGALFNQQRTENAGSSRTVRGAGASSLALKWALPSSNEKVSWALLGAATFATGRSDFNDGKTQYDLGTTVNFALDDAWSTASYANINRLDGVSSYSLSQGLSYAVSSSVGSYVEVGADFARHSPHQAVAGGGLTWMVTPTVQLDLSCDFGLNRNSPDVQGGFGLAAFFQ